MVGAESVAMKQVLRRPAWLIHFVTLRPVLAVWPFLSRLGAGIVDEFSHGLLTLQAMGLVYTTLLSLVPFLAVVFSVLKAFGVQQQLEPLLTQTFGPLGSQGGELTTRLIQFVDNLKVGVLGGLGVAGLFFTVLSLIGQIENALNYIWRVRRARSLVRRFSDYFSVVLVGPVLIFTALALTASAESHWLIQRVLQIQSLGFIVPLVTRLMPLLFVSAAFTFLYKLVPYTRVAWSAAFMGGVTAGLLWQLAGIAFTTFVANSANYTAIYSSFAILIIFPIWLYVSWLIVLIGGKVAYLYQYPYAQLSRTPWQQRSQHFRAWVAFSALSEITRRHLAGEALWLSTELATFLNVSVAHVEEQIDEFIRHGILLRAAEPEGIALSRPPERITASEVFAILDGGEVNGTEARRATDSPTDDSVTRLLHCRDEALRHALEGITLRTLAAEILTQGPQPEVPMLLAASSGQKR